MTTKSGTTKLLPRADQFLVEAMGGVLHANKPVVGGQAADGEPSAALFYWSHSHFTDDFEFGLHRHEGFEIMTFVLDGENSHFDTTGSAWTPLRGGDVQIIRSGSGISHNERVAKGTRAFQIWFDPGYSDALGPHTRLHRPSGRRLHAAPPRGLHGHRLRGWRRPGRLAGRRALHPPSHRSFTPVAQTVPLGQDRYSIVYAIEGPATVEGNDLRTDDALVLHGVDEIAVEARTGTDLFLVSLPSHPGYTPVRGR